MVRITRFALFVLLSCLLATQALHAQRLDGTLRVTVTDKTGASIEDARVTVTNEATNVPKTATASSAGTYVFPDLLVGSYTVTVEKSRLPQIRSLRRFRSQSNQVAEAAAILEIGDVSSVVEVEAGAELVQDRVLRTRRHVRRKSRQRFAGQHARRRRQRIRGLRSRHHHAARRRSGFRWFHRRPAPAIQRILDRRRRRQSPRRERPDAARHSGIGRRIHSAHESVRRRVRPFRRRPIQYRHQVRHQRLARQRVVVQPQSRSRRRHQSGKDRVHWHR